MLYIEKQLDGAEHFYRLPCLPLFMYMPAPSLGAFMCLSLRDDDEMAYCFIFAPLRVPFASIKAYIG